ESNTSSLLWGGLSWRQRRAWRTGPWHTTARSLTIAPPASRQGSVGPKQLPAETTGPGSLGGAGTVRFLSAHRCRFVSRIDVALSRIGVAPALGSCRHDPDLLASCGHDTRSLSAGPAACSSICAYTATFCAPAAASS